MTKVFIIHGWGGIPNGSWRPWLMEELAKKEIYACSLAMPNSEKPILSEWLQVIDDVIRDFGADVIFIGHSLGTPAILQYLNNLNRDILITGAIFVAGPCKALRTENPNDAIRILDHFFEPDFDFEKIKNNAKHFRVIHGDSDQVVPLDHAEHVSRELKCPLSIVKNQGHLNTESGYFESPEVLVAILEMIK